MKKTLFAFAVVGAAVVTSLAAGNGLTSPVQRQEYALVDGFEYQLVSRADFEHERSRCQRILTKRYDELHLTQVQCER